MNRWATIPIVEHNLEAYYKRGLIRDFKTKKRIVIYGRKDRGYRYFFYLINGEYKTIYVHRCVLSAHKPVHGFETLDVHHKDHDPSNNDLDNLIWCTPRENALYSLHDGRLEYSRIRASENAINQLKNGTHPFLNLTQDQHKQKYISRSENYKKNGHPFKGKTGMNAKNVKVSKEMIAEVRKLISDGVKQKDVAAKFSVNRITIYNIISGRIKYE